MFATRYSNGIGTEVSKEETEKGHNMGLYGVGIDKDDNKAFECYEITAESGTIWI